MPITKIGRNCRRFAPGPAFALLTVWVNLAFSSIAGGQIYVATQDVSGISTIGEYNVSTGAPINPSLITGLQHAAGIAPYNGNLYVSNFDAGTIGEYNATTGAPVNPSLITGLDGPTGVTVSGGRLLVASYGGTIGEYTISGAPTNASLVTGLLKPTDIAVSGGDLFVTSLFGTLGKYDANTGATISPPLLLGFTNVTSIAASGSNLYVSAFDNNLIAEYSSSGATELQVTGVHDPFGVAISGSTMFVTRYSDGVVGAYDAVLGTPINASLITGLTAPSAIAVVPEPSTLALATLAFFVVAVWRFRRRSA